MLRQDDYKQLEDLGITEGLLQSQIENFKNGFPVINIVSAAVSPSGLSIFGADELNNFQAIWERELKKGENKITKFVPASGAATRMFKSLYEYLNSAEGSNVDIFIDRIKDFAFYEVLNKKCIELYNKDIDVLIGEREYRSIVSVLLNVEGLNYGRLPKGLLQFHKYSDSDVRTPFMEHLEEGALYAMDRERKVNLHFTISPDHKGIFMEHWEAVKDGYAEKYDARYNVSFSTQAESTNTVAVNLDNTLYRDEKGHLLFRPGGHGALIKNLNDIDSDIIFVKNIDNVAVERFAREGVAYKSVLGGVLIEYQGSIFKYLRELDSDVCTSDMLADIKQFVKNDLKIDCESVLPDDEGAQKVLYRSILNRPIRVCGMVKNLGEPGGGPFVVCNEDGRTSLQILESSQIAEKDVEKMMSSSHFNPVDLVCAVRNYKGEKFDLTEFVDHSTGFISNKSVGGVEIKALELPGLWNGAMSDWNTIFVEVPVVTFNPVKTVNDLLREEHK